MKMPRSQCETGNVQFVQELAEVDGPFEAPININFRDLTKLELPSLVWNRSDACPRKMKITNTGHTVIVSGKWKCERPYLTGGPLLGKYVFSQIHFHWGQTDCKGSEHQICGEEFPLEMHVAHFKAEYMTQECALREKDGMVVVVYLFKLQEEPNHSLKKIINSLPRVKQPSTSCAIDPRPILSLCNPFTDDYFMYWGSVVTSTCAHILLWIICREPFGISKEQVNEFRKIMDLSQQPICKNNRDVQPLHRRNVFHVNASKHLDDPLLPIKKILGCYCKDSKDALTTENSNNCHCQGAFQNQEDVEGNFVECTTENRCSNVDGVNATMHSCFANQTFFVQTAAVQSLSIVLKRAGSDPIKNQCSLDNLKKVKSEVYNQQVKLVSKSCCLFSGLETKKISNFREKRKIREKSKLFNSMKAFTQIMHSLEALKNHTFKKLKKIETINQEIKEMKPFCQNTEDKRWIRKIEKIITKQKRLTIKSSQGCFSDLKKLTKDCNFDNYFEAKALPAGDNDQKLVWLTASMIASAGLPCCETLIENEEITKIENRSSVHFDIGKAIRVSTKAQKLIESFFEDIKDSDELQSTMKKDLKFKKIRSICSVRGDLKSVSIKSKGFITQKMFNLGNLGDRFFTEVTNEDMNLNENYEDEVQSELVEPIITQDAGETKSILVCCESEKSTETIKPNLESSAVSGSKNKDVIPLHRADFTILLPNDNEEKFEAFETVIPQDASFKDEINKPFLLKKKSKKLYLKKSANESEGEQRVLTTNEKLMKTSETKVVQKSSSSQSSSSNLSTESTGTQIVIAANVQNSRKDILVQSKPKLSAVFKISSKKLHNKASCKKFEGIYIPKKNLKNKKKKNLRFENERYRSTCGFSSTNKEEANAVVNKSGWKKVTKAKKLLTKIKNVSTDDSATESILISPERKKLKLECKKLTQHSSKEDTVRNANNNINLTATETRTIITDSSPKHQKSEVIKEKEVNTEEESTKKLLEETSLAKRRSITFENTENEPRTISKIFTNRTYRVSSADLKTNYIKVRTLKEFEDNNFESRLENFSLKREIPKVIEGRSLSKTNCQSLTNISTTFKSDFIPRFYLESINKRKKSNKNAFVTTINLGKPKNLKETCKIMKNLSREASNETNEHLKEELEERKQKDTNQSLESLEKCEIKTQNMIEYNTKNYSQVVDGLLPKLQKTDGKEKNITLQPSNHYFLEKKFQKPNEEDLEILLLTDSNQSFTRNASEVNGDFLIKDNKNPQTSVSFSTLKINSTNRPHSVETFHSVKKTLKLKNKKRQRRHYCKRNSRHYIRKKYSVLGKPSKLFNFMNFTDEEQLKIISVNVAKYIKQKLMDEKSQSQAEKDSHNIPEKDSQTLSVSKEKSDGTPIQSTTIHRAKTKNFRIPVLKPIKRTNEKEKEKHMRNIKQPNLAEPQTDTVKTKSAFASSPRPVNNFIKLNKQMAGRYKRLAPTTLKKMESKKREKTHLETKLTKEIPKPKIKALNKSKENFSNSTRKVQEELHSRPPTPSSPIIQIPAAKGVVRKEKQVKGPATPRKPDSKTVATDKEQRSSKAAKPNKSIGVKLKPDSQKTLFPSAGLKEISQASTMKNTQKISTCRIDSDSEVPEIAENLKRNSFQHDVMKYDDKGSMEEESKNQVLLKKELEYFITMQMYLNNKISKDTESPPNYFNSKLLNPYCKTSENPTANDSLHNLDFFNKDVFLIQKNLEECSSSCSEFIENSAKFCQEKDSTHEKKEESLKSKKILTVRAPKELNDSTEIKPAPAREGSEDSPSDSSYDCKISITLNTNLNAKKTENEKQSYDDTYCLKENFNSQTTTSLEGSSSQLTDKPESKKKKESEISLEMKQKLLEILEGEIKREIGISCGVSSENSSDGFGLKAGESEANLRSQSTESSSDNIEALAQISSSMRQYLTYLRDVKRVSNENKDYEEF